MRVLQQPACIVHRHDYSESSLLLELFTRDFGRVGVIAKGARRHKSGARGLLNPFSPLLLSWTGRGELGVLTETETNGLPVVLSGEALYCGFYINELLLRLLHRHDAHEALFEGYQNCLNALQTGQSNDAALRIFEALLLQEIGYGLVLDRDTVDNMPIHADWRYEYIADSGPRRLQSGVDAQQGIEIQGASLLALVNGKLGEPHILKDLKRLTRFVLERHLGGRPLNSRKLMQSVKQRTTSGVTQN